MNLFQVTICLALMACQLTHGGVVRNTNDTKGECKDMFMGYLTCKDQEALYANWRTFCQHYARECCETCRRYKAESETLVERLLEDLLNTESNH